MQASTKVEMRGDRFNYVNYLDRFSGCISVESDAKKILQYDHWKAETQFDFRL